MRLGELRNIIREFDNKLVIMLSCYSDGRVYNLEFDMSNDNEMYFRIVDEDDEG